MNSILIELLNGLGYNVSRENLFGKVKGLLTHTNVRRDKTDCYPDERLIDIILSL